MYARAIPSDRPYDFRALVRQVRDAPAVNRAVSNLSRRLARYSLGLARSLELHGGRVGEIRVELPNGRELVLWSAGGDDWARMWWRGWDSYEGETIRPWFRLAERAQTILDVGANAGLFAIVAGLANPGARCYAFEPMPRNREVLERNVRSNPLASVTVVPAAAGATEGTLDLFWDPSMHNDLQATLDPTHRDPGVELTREAVQVVALDGWARTAGVTNVELVKIDAEGHEPEVLSGMQSMLSNRPDVIIEILDQRTADAVAEVIEQFGYHHYMLTPVGGPIKTELVEPHAYLNRWGAANHLLTAREHAEVTALW